jgi:hypothetical protein
MNRTKESTGCLQSQSDMGMALDDRDRAVLAARVAAINSTEGPRVGDWVDFVDGVTRQIAHVWPWGVQTSDYGSFYLDEGYMAFSGGLHQYVPTETLTLTEDTRYTSAWFFHHDQWRAHNRVHVRVLVQLWISSAEAPKGRSDHTTRQTN